MSKNVLSSDSVVTSTLETEDLHKNLKKLFELEFYDGVTGITLNIGNFKWGVYAFFDYDGEPIYVGQTNEKLRTRIRRHLTNQRTDAVAMSVLDPFEVYEIEVWPLPQFENAKSSDNHAKDHLNALEFAVHEKLIRQSHFNAVLNEKNPPRPKVPVSIPNSLRRKVVSDEVYNIRSHPDFRIARRALTVARLAQVISERKVKPDLRRVLLTQAKRLQWLTERRFIASKSDNK